MATPRPPQPSESSVWGPALGSLEFRDILLRLVNFAFAVLADSGYLNAIDLPLDSHFANAVRILGNFCWLLPGCSYRRHWHVDEEVAT